MSPGINPVQLALVIVSCNLANTLSLDPFFPLEIAPWLLSSFLIGSGFALLGLRNFVFFALALFLGGIFYTIPIAQAAFCGALLGYYFARTLHESSSDQFFLALFIGFGTQQVLFETNMQAQFVISGFSLSTILLLEWQNSIKSLFVIPVICYLAFLLYAPSLELQSPRRNQPSPLFLQLQKNFPLEFASLSPPSKEFWRKVVKAKKPDFSSAPNLPSSVLFPLKEEPVKHIDEKGVVFSFEFERILPSLTKHWGLYYVMQDEFRNFYVLGFHDIADFYAIVDPVFKPSAGLEDYPVKLIPLLFRSCFTYLDVLERNPALIHQRKALKLGSGSEVRNSVHRSISKYHRQFKRTWWRQFLKSIEPHPLQSVEVHRELVNYYLSHQEWGVLESLIYNYERHFGRDSLFHTALYSLLSSNYQSPLASLYLPVKESDLNSNLQLCSSRLETLKNLETRIIDYGSRFDYGLLIDTANACFHASSRKQHSYLMEAMHYGSKRIEKPSYDEPGCMGGCEKSWKKKCGEDGSCATSDCSPMPNGEISCPPQKGNPILDLLKIAP